MPNEFGGKLSQRIELVYSILHSLKHAVRDDEKIKNNIDILLQELDNTLQKIRYSLKCEAEFHHGYIAALFIAGAAVQKSITKEEVFCEPVAPLCSYIEEAEAVLRQSYEAEKLCGRQVELLAFIASVSFLRSKVRVVRDVLPWR